MYRQITVDERYTLGALRKTGRSGAAIAHALGRHRSTIWRELHRNRAASDGSYRPQLAEWYARRRRSESRRHGHFRPHEWARVRRLLHRDWSPDQVAGHLRRHQQLRISHETIYRHIWADKRAGGVLYLHLRGARKRYRKRYGQRDSRGRLPGKRPITARPAIVERRTRIGDWEGDTILGADGTRPCVLSLVERKTGYVLLGQLGARTAAAVQQRAATLCTDPAHPIRTLTLDNGTEFHGYAALEAVTGARVYFATPHHAWERGTNENTNGLVRQYLPKRTSLAHLTQADCTTIARRLNQRPRRRLGYRTPEECYAR